MESITPAVVGSRCFADYQLFSQLFSQLLSEQLDHIRDTYSKTSGVETIVSGGACGTDRLAERYAKEHGMRMRVLLPDWKKGRLPQLPWEGADLSVHRGLTRVQE
jgi:YspA, cpYpsA-related SLOG family